MGQETPGLRTRKRQGGADALYWCATAEAVKAGNDKAEREIRHNRMRADAHALRWIAEKECPESVKEFGRVNGIPTFAEFTWNHGFEQGWRMAMASITRATGGTDA